ncbi:hypothetical protein ElyMa_006520400 [Elysia marginata]|uniref:Uncharacterized protein n=1 Tax=Elysia marginata TaxID=1093978 RepID=A0AAV4I9W9_9GAST|nr:hypothetical protein ElyMa_006520400 [Elysia marginata]
MADGPTGSFRQSSAVKLTLRMGDITSYVIVVDAQGNSSRPTDDNVNYLRLNSVRKQTHAICVGNTKSCAHCYLPLSESTITVFMENEHVSESIDYVCSIGVALDVGEW